MSEEPHHVVIVGGGAAGLELATRLGNTLGRRGTARVTLVDANRTHLWKPLLHEVASGASDPADLALEYLAHARWHHFRFRLGRLESVDRAQRLVWVAPTLDDAGEELIPRRSFHYDTLVLAVGSTSNDFGVPGVQEHCVSLDSQKDAERFQKHLLETLIRANTAARAPEPGELDVAIVGGGATGVELAAQLRQVTRILSQYGLDEISPDRDIRITVMDAGPRLLPALPDKLAASVTAELENLGVRVMCGQQAVAVSAEGVHTQDGGLVPARIKVWAAGIKGPDCLANLGLELAKGHQVVVNTGLQSPQDDAIFALGDCAACPMDGDSGTVPPRAQAAHQQAAFLARAISRRVKGKPPRGAYRYRDYGSLVTLGSYSTVGSLMGAVAGNVWVSGLVARLVYLSLYRMHLVALHGYWRTAMLTLSQLLRRSVDPAVKLH